MKPMTPEQRYAIIDECLAYQVSRIWYAERTIEDAQESIKRLQKERAEVESDAKDEAQS
jgi:(2Fe-2S) ferredoxin